MLKLVCYTHPKYRSCTYLVYQPDTLRAILVDPAGSSFKVVIPALEKGRFVLDYILLTHEHYDHIAGADELRQNTGAKLVCSAECSRRIMDPRLNLSAYIDEGAVRIAAADVQLNDDRSEVMWGETDIIFIFTPGHSPGGACIILNSWVFTGDTLLEQRYSPVHLPGGDKALLKQSHQRIKDSLNADAQIYPGHGNPFTLSKIPSSMREEASKRAPAFIRKFIKQHHCSK